MDFAKRKQLSVEALQRDLLFTQVGLWVAAVAACEDMLVCACMCVCVNACVYIAKGLKGGFVQVCVGRI